MESKTPDTNPGQLEISTPSSPPVSQPKKVSLGAGTNSSDKSKRMEDLLGPAADVPAPTETIPTPDIPSELPQTEEESQPDTKPPEKKKKKPPKVDNFGPSIGGL